MIGSLMIYEFFCPTYTVRILSITVINQGLVLKAGPQAFPGCYDPSYVKQEFWVLMEGWPWQIPWELFIIFVMILVGWHVGAVAGGLLSALVGSRSLRVFQGAVELREFFGPKCSTEKRCTNRTYPNWSKVFVVQFSLIKNLECCGVFSLVNNESNTYPMRCQYKNHFGEKSSFTFYLECCLHMFSPSNMLY